MTIEYDGTDFHGWQSQPGLSTVQGELSRALEEITGRGAEIVGAGRTDAGVHAAGQVASVRLETNLSPTELRRAMTAKLPGDIVVRKIEEVQLSFNARFDARSRTYSYVFIQRPTALWRRYYYLITGDVDISAMRGAIRGFLGEHDFTSFCGSADAGSSKKCRVTKAGIVQSPPLVLLSFTADHFLYRMVRSAAGTILEIGRGKPMKISEIIAARSRAAAGPTLPPHALFLMEVRY